MSMFLQIAFMCKHSLVLKAQYVKLDLSGWCVCVCVCMQEDLSVPLLQEDLDGSSGVIFPFYDPDTHMLYLAGKVRLHSLSRTFSTSTRL